MIQSNLSNECTSGTSSVLVHWRETRMTEDVYGKAGPGLHHH